MTPAYKVITRESKGSGRTRQREGRSGGRRGGGNNMIGRESGGRSRETNHETRLNDENREAGEAGGGGDGRGATRNRYHTRDKKYPRSRAIASISLLRFYIRGGSRDFIGPTSARGSVRSAGLARMARRKPARTQRATDNHRRVHSHVLPRSEVGWYVDAGSRGPYQVLFPHLGQLYQSESPPTRSRGARGGAPAILRARTQSRRLIPYHARNATTHTYISLLFLLFLRTIPISSQSRWSKEAKNLKGRFPGFFF